MAIKQYHDIDGRKMTVEEIAAMLGVTVGAIQRRKSDMGGCTYQLIVDMYRDNRIPPPGDNDPRHLIDGKWVSVRQVAARIGVKPHSITNWMSARRMKGEAPTLKDAIDHFEAFKRYGRKPRVGAQHSVKGHMMTIPQAAAKYGVTDGAIYMYMREHKCSLETYVRRLEKRRMDKAVRDIVGAILRE